MSRIAIGYIRVSTTEQASEGVSLDAQRAKIEAWAVLGGHKVAMVACDSGLSGKAAFNRPGLQEALDRACKEKGVLVTYSLSRLARSTVDAINIGERLQKAGADLVSITESIETHTAAGKMVFRMLAVLGEFERDLLVERTKTAMRYKRSQGQRISGAIPLGFDLNDDGRTLSPNPAEQETLALVSQWHGEGRSLRQICAGLIDMKAANKSGVVRWTPSRIQGIIRRCVAVGA